MTTDEKGYPTIKAKENKANALPFWRSRFIPTLSALLLVASSGLSVALAQEQSWQQIGERGAFLVATDELVSVISTDRNQIWEYDGAPNKWTKIGDRAKQLAAAGNSLYVISTDANAIWRYDGSPDRWTKIGDRAKQLVAAGSNLYVISTELDQIWRYDGAPDRWTKIGDRAKQLAAAGDNLYVISTERDQIWRYDGAPDRWTKIGDRAKQITAAGDDLYVISTDRDQIWRYDGAPDGWTKIGDRAKQIAAAGEDLYVISADADAIWMYDGAPDQWTQFGDRGKQLAPNSEALYVIRTAADGIWARAAAAKKDRLISLRSDHGRYLVAEGDHTVAANRTAIGPWEKWTLIDNGDGTVSLESDHGRFLVAESNHTVAANRTAIGPWEKWTLVDNGDGTVSLKSSHGRYLVAEADHTVAANRTAIGPWEKWTLVPSDATSQSSLEAFYGSHAGKLTFTEQYRQALSTMLLAQDDVANSRYREARERIDRLWASYPKGSASWKTTGDGTCHQGGACTGKPVAYASLRMLEEIADHGLAAGLKPVARNLGLTIVLPGCSTATKPGSVDDLRNGTGTNARGQILADLTADGNRILKQSTALFRDYVHAMTGGRVHLELSVVSLPDVCVKVPFNFDVSQLDKLPPAKEPLVGSQPDITPIWAALPKDILDSTDLYWVLYPSQVPEDVPAFANYVFVTGGMYISVAPNDASAIVCDDRFVTRNPPHLGSGPYSEVERRAWLPQWFQHEFFHLLYSLYPDFELEAVSHQWQSKDWPSDFAGNERKIEADYYAESLHKRLQTSKAKPPLDVALRFVLPSPSEWASMALSPADLVGRYEMKNPPNDWLEGEILSVGGQLRWKNDANVGWSLTPNLAGGHLANRRLATGPGNRDQNNRDFYLVLARDAGGNWLPQILGFRFGSVLFLRQ